MPLTPTDRRIDKLVQLLATNATVVVPGPKIAEEIGVTRGTVWTWIEKLRELGVEIKGHPSTGYQLEKLPDLLLPGLLKPELGDGGAGGKGEPRIGHKIIHYFRIDSTNSAALEVASTDPASAPHGTVIVAEEQTAGRGRFGRDWYSEKSSGIYVSIILRPQLSPAAAPALTLMAGVAGSAVLRAATALEVDIRWPNDLLIGGRKLAGILTEMSAEVDRLHVVVIGMGINVNHSQMPDELKPIATSMRMETGRIHSRSNLLVSLLKQIDLDYRLLLDRGSVAIAERWAALSSYANGKAIRVRSGTAEFTAVTVGVDPSGALRVRREDGQEESLVAGEIVEVK